MCEVTDLSLFSSYFCTIPAFFSPQVSVAIILTHPHPHPPQLLKVTHTVTGVRDKVPFHILADVLTNIQKNIQNMMT